MKLANGDFVIRPMGATVDIQAAHPANPLPAVVVECDRLLVFVDQLLIEDIDHLQERAVRRDVIELIRDKPAFGPGVFLSPDFEK